MMIDHRKERTKLRINLNRARKAGLPATLTIDEWLAILKHFDYECAYCRYRRLVKYKGQHAGAPFQLMEHITAINNGGGTTATNCVPGCLSCNRRKDSKRIDDPLPRYEIEWVKAELAKALGVKPGELIVSDEEAKSEAA